MSRIIKILFLTNSIIIDVYLVPEHRARACFVLFPRNFTKKHEERYESCLLSFGVYPFVIFSCNFISRVRSLFSSSTLPRAPRKYRHYSSIMLLFFYTMRAIRKTPRLASPVSLLYIRRWVYEFYYALKLLLCLWHVFFIDANLFHIVVRSRGNKASPLPLTSIMHHLF